MSTTQMAPRNQVLDAIQKAKPQFEGRLPKDMTVERFMFGIQTSIQKNSDLALCEPRSVLLAAYEAAECGCDLSPSRQLGWLIPYGKVAQFQPSYRFFIQEAHASGAVRAFFAEVVYAADKFERQFAPKRNLFHAPADGDRGTPIGVYAHIEYQSGAFDWEYLTVDQVARHRAKSKQPDSMKWKAFWEEGWRITAIRVLFKRVPLMNPGLERLAETIEKDAAHDLDLELSPGGVEFEPESPLAAPQPETLAPEPSPAPEPPTAAPIDATPISSEQFDEIYLMLPDLNVTMKEAQAIMRKMGHKGTPRSFPAAKFDEFVAELKSRI